MHKNVYFEILIEEIYEQYGIHNSGCMTRAIYEHFTRSPFYESGRKSHPSRLQMYGESWT